MLKFSKNTKGLFFLLSSSFFLLPSFPAQAVCPVCTFAVGAGVGLARYFGVDDMISGVWIGGLVLSVAFWTENWLQEKNMTFRYRRPALVLGYYAVSILPLYFTNIMGHPLNRICGVDKLLVGIIFGSLGFWLGGELNMYYKKRNGGKVYFPFQKVAFGVAPLVILSLVFYIISKC